MNTKKLLVLLVALFMTIVSVSCKKEDDPTYSFPVGPYFDVESYDITYKMDEGNGSNRAIVFGNSVLATLFVNWTREEEQAKREWLSTDLFDSQGMPTNSNGEVCVSDKVVLIYDYEGNLVSDINLNNLIGEFYEIPSICIDSQDKIHVLVTMTSMEERTYTYFHLVFDMNGVLLCNEQLHVDEYYYIFEISYTNDGLCVFAENDYFEQLIVVFSDEGYIIEKLENIEGSIERIYTINGKTYLELGMFSNDASEYYSVIVSLEDICKRDSNLYTHLSSGNQHYFGTSQGLIYLDASSQIVNVNIDTGEITNQISIAGLDLGATYSHMGITGEHEFCIVGSGYLDTSYRLSVLRSSAVNPNEEKETIRIGGIGINNDPIVMQMKYLYNSSNEMYRVEIVDYAELYDSTHDIQELIEIFIDDITNPNGNPERIDVIFDLTGDIVDRLRFSNNVLSEISIEELAYISNNELSGNALSCCAVNGNIMSLPLGYYVEGLIVNSSNYQTSYNWTIDDYNFIAENYNGQMIPDVSAIDLLTIQLFASNNEFFNISNQEVSFNSPEFVSVLEWAKNNEDVMLEGVQYPYMYYIEDEMHYSQCMINTNIDTVYSLISNLSDNVSYVGFPTNNASRIGIETEYEIAILSESEYFEEALEFVSKGLDISVQNAISRVMMPIDDNSIEYGVEQVGRSYFVDINDSLMEEVYVTVWNIIDDIDYVNYFHNEVTNIVLEEANAYFYGDRTALEVAEYIQDRASTVMSERYG